MFRFRPRYQIRVRDLVRVIFAIGVLMALLRYAQRGDRWGEGGRTLLLVAALSWVPLSQALRRRREGRRALRAGLLAGAANGLFLGLLAVGAAMGAAPAGTAFTSSVGGNGVVLAAVSLTGMVVFGAAWGGVIGLVVTYRGGGRSRGGGSGLGGN